MIVRTLTPELLDSLPPQHPDALHSRRDLRWINFGLGNPRWFARTLPPLLRAGERALELGAGTGEFATRLGARGVAVDGIDFSPCPENWPTARTWHTGDLRTFARFGDYAAVCGNLIFHHFSDAQLAELGARFRDTARVVVASEPKRSRISQRLFALTAPLWGANPVTVHDGRVSIAAGFRNRELADALGLDERHWDIRQEVSAISTYRMVAVRRA